VNETLNRIKPEPVVGRARLAARWARFMLRSVTAGHYDFAGRAMRAEMRLMLLTARDALSRCDAVECNICGWTGARFYPNTGPGYDELDILCPGCRGLDRHRALVAVLRATTDYFAPGRRVIEVAPMRRLQALCLAQPGNNYTSFDLMRFAMERGDLTAMRFEDHSVDYFTCFHVLEHVPEEGKALAEIRRVLKPGGTAVVQVPVDWSVENTYNYDGPNERETGHVRRYGKDFGPRLEAHGFKVTSVSASDCCTPGEIRRFGMSREPIFFATKPA
jgi:SAM-dependent methyltransferase